MLRASFVWRSWGSLGETVMSGRPAFDQVHGKSLYDYLDGHPVDAAIFNAAMTAGSSMGIRALLTAYDFSRFQKIADIGGGHGALLRAILLRHPGVRGILFDLPAVVAGAGIPRRGAVTDRCEIVGGDFFKSVPPGADAYLLKSVIHNWDDADGVRILGNCHRQMRSDGTLLLVETVLDQPAEATSSELFMDLMMATLSKGKERTAAEFEELLSKAGFKLIRIIAVPGADSILESRPVRPRLSPGKRKRRTTG